MSRAIVRVKVCACGCPHKIEYGDFPGDFHDRARPDCKCTEYVAPARVERYHTERAKAEARLNTPEERARIAAEVERLRAERELIEPLNTVLDRIGVVRRRGTQARRR